MASSRLDILLPPRKEVASPFTGEVIDRDDKDALVAALNEIEAYLDGLYGKHRQVYRARDEIKARLGELSPTDLPARRNQTDKQAKIDRCPRCRTRLPQVQIIEDAPGEPDGVTPAASAADPPSVAASVRAPSADDPPSVAFVRDEAPSPGVTSSGSLPLGGAAGPAPPDPEQSELLPEGPRSEAQDAALGLTVFGEKVNRPIARDPIIEAAGEVLIPQGQRAGKSVAWVAENDPDWCLWYLKNGKTEKLKAAITTFLHATRPDLMEGSK